MALRPAKQVLVIPPQCSSGERVCALTSQAMLPIGLHGPYVYENASERCTERMSGIINMIFPMEPILHG